MSRPQAKTGASGRVARLRRFLVPVLEDALERSLALAAGMDTRGYGRAPGESAGRRRVTGGLLLGALIGIAVGVYAVLDRTAPRYLALPMLGAGTMLSVAGMWSAGRRVTRTRYRPDRWRLPELLTAATGIMVAAATYAIGAGDVALAHPALDVAPTMSLELLLALLLGVAPAVLTPPPARPWRSAPRTREPDTLEVAA